MPTPETPKSATLALKDYIGDTCVSILTDMNYDTPSAHVWKDLPPSSADYPFIHYTAREQPSIRMSHKGGEDVRAVAEVHVRGFDDVEVDEIAANVQETLNDKTVDPSVSGFRVVWHNLLVHLPMNETRDDEEDVFGRVLEIEYELEPTT